MPRLLAMLLLASCVPACSLLLDTSGAAGERPADGRTPADSGGVEDAAADVTSDGGSDAACAADELCDDFEGNATLVWEPGVAPSGRLVVDGTKPRSGQKSLHASKVADGGTDAKIIARFASPITVRGCSFDYFAQVTSGTTPGLEVFAHYWQPGQDDTFDDYEALGIFIRGNDADLTESLRSPYQADGVAIPALVPPLGRWIHVDTDMKDNRRKVFVDGVLSADKAAVFTPSSHGSEAIILGVNFEGDTTTRWDVFIDNVRCKIVK